jgi:3-hydroxyisobutyrate dehydrogenase-like beta-hydroxyacid dehydrogenase
MKSEVSIIGLGEMGAALARTLVRNHTRVTVWNRTTAKANALVEEGAVLAASPTEAVAASPVIIVNISDYAATYALFESPEVARALQAKVLVQLTTGTPQDARNGEAWARKRGIDYLDGAILAVPPQMGTPESTIFVSGSRSAYERSEPLLTKTAGVVAYHGEPVGVASALDLAFIATLFNGLLGFYHGARICETEGIPVTALGSMIASVAPAIGQMMQHDGTVIEAGAYERPVSSLRTCWAGMDLIARHAREAKMNGEIPSFAAALFQRAIDRGLGEEGAAALVKLLREEA